MAQFDREDYRFGTNDKLLNAKVAADPSAPSTVTDGYSVNTSNKRGVRYIGLRGMIRNAADNAEGTDDVLVWVWFYDPNAPGNLKWFCSAAVKMYLQSNIDADTNQLKGNIYQIVKPAGCTRVDFVTSGCAAGNVLHLAIERDT